MDAFAGSAGVSDSDGMGTPVLSVCTPKSESISNEYYAHIVRLMGKNGFILSLYRGVRERSSDFRFDTFANLDFQNFVNARVFQAAVSQLSANRL